VRSCRNNNVAWEQLGSPSSPVTANRIFFEGY
jgi:hypothetical protein